MWWGGLKGGLAIAIVLSIPGTLPGRELLINLTLGVVLFTLMVNAWSIRPLMKKLKLDRLTGDENAELEKAYVGAKKSSSDMVTQYQQLGLVSEKLATQLKKNIGHCLAGEAQKSSSSVQRKVYLACLRVELDTVNQLYAAGIINQYTVTDIRNTLQLDRDAHANKQENKSTTVVQTSLSIFQKIEMWLLKILREKNWAAALLSRYQIMRLKQRIQRDIAGLVMSEAVLHYLTSQKDLSEDAVAEEIKLAQQRFHRRKERLDSLHQEFSDFYEAIIENIFNRALYKTAQLKIDFDLHHGEIGMKAYTLIAEKFDVVLKSSGNVIEIENTDIVDQLCAVPLFQNLSQQSALALSKHAQRVTFLKNDIIIGEGEKGDALYLLERGSATASIKIENGTTRVLGEFSPGDFFGEIALLGDHVRKATVTAQSAVTLLRLTRKDVLNIAAQHDEVRQCLEASLDVRLAEKKPKNE